MATYNISLQLFSVLNASAANFQIFADGVQLGSNLTVASTGIDFSSAVSYFDPLPSSLEFKFFDTDTGTVDQIEVRSVLINDRYVNTGNFLSVSTLNDSETAVIDVTAAAFLFDTSEPEISVFTTGATQNFTAGVDVFRYYIQSTAQVFDTGAGNDFIWTGSGADKISGGSGDDYLRTSGGNDLISGGSGNDKLFGDAGDDTIYGGVGLDKINGGSGDDKLFGGDGHDKLIGQSGEDILVGEDGDDRLNGGSDNDVLYGDAGIDVLIGASGDDTLDGGADNDVLYGGADEDIINGGFGDDVIVGGSGNDILYGNDGSDQFVFGANSSFGYIDTIGDFAVGEDVIDISNILSSVTINILNVANYIDVDIGDFELSIDVTGSSNFSAGTKIIGFTDGIGLANVATMWLNGDIIA